MTIGYNRIINSYGEPVQQSLTIDPADHQNFNTNRLVLGVVLQVNPADSEYNRSAIQKEDRRGYLHTATVLVVSDMGGSTFSLENVIITPDAVSGLDDYCEHLPRASSAIITGEPLSTQLTNLDPYTLDGDWCVVGFLGGNLDQPFIVRWWPHSKNPFDPATSGGANPNLPSAPRNLVQDGRYFKRVNGVEFTVTKKGNVYLSTYRANSTLNLGSGSLAAQDGRFPRTTNARDGGSVKVWVKPSQTFEVDWNVPDDGLGASYLPDPEIPQSNPRNVQRADSAASETKTYVSLTEDSLNVSVPDTIGFSSKRRLLLDAQEDTTISVGNTCVLLSPSFGIELNEPVGILKLTNRLNGDSLTFDTNTNSVALSATTNLSLSSVGTVTITGSQVIINGRVVRPSADPI